MWRFFPCVQGVVHGSCSVCTCVFTPLWWLLLACFLLPICQCSFSCALLWMVLFVYAFNSLVCPQTVVSTPVPMNKIVVSWRLCKLSNGLMTHQQCADVAICDWLSCAPINSLCTSNACIPTRFFPINAVFWCILVHTLIPLGHSTSLELLLETLHASPATIVLYCAKVSRYCVYLLSCELCCVLPLFCALPPYLQLGLPRSKW